VAIPPATGILHVATAENFQTMIETDDALSFEKRIVTFWTGQRMLALSTQCYHKAYCAAAGNHRRLFRKFQLRWLSLQRIQLKDRTDRHLPFDRACQQRKGECLGR
jgi:hypothetical protein